MSAGHAESRTPIEPFVGPGQIVHHVADLTMVASADVSLSQLQAKLSEHDQWLPIDGDSASSLGQLVSFNSTGPLRLGFGGWRDIGLQFQFRIRRGDLVTVGARTMKNVAGYDVTKLLVGQRGLLGELVTVSTRTYKRPQQALIATFRNDPKLIPTLLPTHSRPAWALVRRNQIHCGYFGDGAAVKFFENVLAEYAPIIRCCTPNEEDAFRYNNWSTRSASLAFRASVPPTKVFDALAHLQLEDAAADPVFGVIVGSCSEDMRERIRAVVNQFGTVLFDNESPIARMSGPQRKIVDGIVAAF